jgi:hypothetical protein
MSNTTYVVSYAENKQFVNLLNSLFEIVDGLACDDKINSGEYNDIAMTIKSLFQMRQTIQRNIVYKRMERRSTMNEPQRRKTEMEKLNDIKNNPDTQYIVCNECDAILVKDSLYNHIKTKKCLGIRQSKVVAINIKKIKSIKYVKLQVYNYNFAPIFDGYEKKIKELQETEGEIFDSHYEWIKVGNCKWKINDNDGVEETKD